MFNKIRRLFTNNTDAEKNHRLKNGLSVGENTAILSWEGIDAGWPWLISIGSNTIISSGVTILAHDASTTKVKCPTKLGLVSIGDNCFIGAKSIVLCNVRIGDNVIVGAGSVVTKNLESGYVYAGNPARKICSIEEYHQKYTQAREERPYFGDILPWNEWNNATEEQRQKMKDLLSDGFGFI